MKKLTPFVLLSFGLLASHNFVSASPTDIRVNALAEKILHKVPEIKITFSILGRGAERPVMAEKHARAIIAASDKYADRWNQFKDVGGWTAFDPHYDLPALVAAIALKESHFKSVVRNDDNSVQETIPADLKSARKRVDAGVMQVRVPSDPAKRCGVVNDRDIHRLVREIEFAYDVGTCVLTNRLAYYIPKYKETKNTRLSLGLRPNKDLKFFGVLENANDPELNRLLQELVVIERYNWGDANLYQHDVGAGYARRVLTAFQFFKNGTVSGS